MTDMGNTCFWVPHTKKEDVKRFADAKGVCKANGGQLAVLSTNAKVEHIKNVTVLKGTVDR